MTHFHFCSVDALIAKNSQCRAAESVEECGQNIGGTRSMEDGSLLCARGHKDDCEWHLLVAFLCC